MDQNSCSTSTKINAQLRTGEAPDAEWLWCRAENPGILGSILGSIPHSFPLLVSEVANYARSPKFHPKYSI